MNLFLLTLSLLSFLLLNSITTSIGVAVFCLMSSLSYKIKSKFFRLSYTILFLVNIISYSFRQFIFDANVDKLNPFWALEHKFKFFETIYDPFYVSFVYPVFISLLVFALAYLYKTYCTKTAFILSSGEVQPPPLFISKVLALFAIYLSTYLFQDVKPYLDLLLPFEFLIPLSLSYLYLYRCSLSTKTLVFFPIAFVLALSVYSGSKGIVFAFIVFNISLYQYFSYSTKNSFLSYVHRLFSLRFRRSTINKNLRIALLMSFAFLAFTFALIRRGGLLASIDLASTLIKKAFYILSFRLSSFDALIVDFSSVLTPESLGMSITQLPVQVFSKTVPFFSSSFSSYGQVISKYFMKVPEYLSHSGAFGLPGTLLYQSQDNPLLLGVYCILLYVIFLYLLVKLPITIVSRFPVLALAWSSILLSTLLTINISGNIDSIVASSLILVYHLAFIRFIIL